VEYIAKREAPQKGQPAKDWDKDAVATLESEIKNDLKACPIFKVHRPLKCWMGDKALPIVRQLFNEESDASFYQFTTITGGLFVFTDDPNKWSKGISLTPFGAVIAGKEDKIDRDKADPATLQALQAACKERRSQLGGLIHAMARQLAIQTSSGQNTSRATGEAVSQHGETLDAFLASFAEPHLACWRQMADAIAKVRNDDISESVEIGGLSGPYELPGAEEEPEPKPKEEEEKEVA
jgi:hypothetical protein